VFSGALFGGSVVVLGLTPVFAIAVIVVAFIGAGSAGYQSLSNTIALNMTEAPIQGRVQSLVMLSFAGFGIAAAPLGLLAEVIGLRPAIVVMGAIALTALAWYAVTERAVQVTIERGIPLDDVALTL
jgi:MFS family permease